MILLDSGLFNQIIISAIVFLVIILILVVVLLYARSKLVPSGPVKLTINEEKEIEVS
ncbi:MAG: NADH:ubiquinone reductase (Na(+)-transporting) subunit F, partial [Bacteroidetes bacterium]|nr:NADH:ubiquinone reductase (Na(+)-transporting) subunit F [Bacteroidota bacterium]